jgi:glutamate decarboxylase
MGHLSTVHTAHSHRAHRGHGSGASRVQASEDEDAFTTASYGSRYARMELPRHQLPEKEMPREIAYRLIKDHLSLDNNPSLKYVPKVSILMVLILIPQSLASFVTTYMVNSLIYL